jgi:hypothetical protein
VNPSPPAPTPFPLHGTSFALSESESSAPPLDAAAVDHRNRGRFLRSTTWKRSRTTFPRTVREKAFPAAAGQSLRTSADIQRGHSARTFSADIQRGHSARTFSADNQRLSKAQSKEPNGRNQWRVWPKKMVSNMIGVAVNFARIGLFFYSRSRPVPGGRR